MKGVNDVLEHGAFLVVDGVSVFLLQAVLNPWYSAGGAPSVGPFSASSDAEASISMVSI
ncbi:hypothetical protein Pta6605_41810 [Pseudomonas amygdali pv. tabaci]|nr:hypothetical protein Pta6605_41810 [Pseudomonas amygdali pv. tabaci]